MNPVMKRLTVLAMIGLPFTVISGYVGMGFEVMPWLKLPWGIAAATVMFGLSASAFMFLKGHDWLWAARGLGRSGPGLGSVRHLPSACSSSGAFPGPPRRWSGI